MSFAKMGPPVWRHSSRIPICAIADQECEKYAKTSSLMDKKSWCAMALAWQHNDGAGPLGNTVVDGDEKHTHKF